MGATAPEEIPGLGPLWEHHVRFQQAVNYYLLALASRESRRNTPLGALKIRMAETWEDWLDPQGHRRQGLGRLLREPLQ